MIGFKRKRLWLIGSIIVAVILTSAFFIAFLNREPVYQGKRLTAWLDDLGVWIQLQSANSIVRLAQSRIRGIPSPISNASLYRSAKQRHDEATNAILKIGPNAVPFLDKIIRKQEGWLSDLKRRRVNTYLARQSLIRWRIPLIHTRQQAAFEAMRLLGSDSDNALVNIVMDIRLDSEVRRDAIGSLSGKASMSVVRALEKLLNEQDATLSQRASYMLSMCDPENVHPRIAQARSGPIASRNGALWMLGHSKREPSLVVPVLINALDDPEPSLRESAAEALGKFGAEAQSAVTALTKRLDDPKLYVRSAVTNALRAIRSGIADSLAELSILAAVFDNFRVVDLRIP